MMIPPVKKYQARIGIHPVRFLALIHQNDMILRLIPYLCSKKAAAIIFKMRIA